VIRTSRGAFHCKRDTAPIPHKSKIIQYTILGRGCLLKPSEQFTLDKLRNRIQNPCFEKHLLYPCLSLEHLNLDDITLVYITMSSANSIPIDADGSNRGHRQPHAQTYDEALNEEYALELATLGGAAPTVEAIPHEPVVSELDKAHAQVKIETMERRGWTGITSSLEAFPKKLRGGLDKRMPIPPFREVVWSWVAAFLGILSLSVLNEWLGPIINLPLLVGSFGASAVLLCAVPESKLSQPRNFVGGHILSAITGVVVRLIIHQVWIAQPVGMSIALVVMQLTSTIHPPGGATALIACSFEEIPKWAGFSFVVAVAFSSAVMLLVVLVVNGVNPGRQYPTFWY
jgi:CBS domain-containing membrane protein